jgi:threonine dehydrogenase-like Zn-dependent dehydrogenase
MRALAFDGRVVRLDSARPVPIHKHGEALVKVTRAMVSSIDLAIARGWLSFTGVLGHECVGIVESIDGVEAPAPVASMPNRAKKPRSVSANAGDSLLGRRVAVSMISACGHCDMCKSGMSRHCRERTLLGMSGRDGCLAEYCSIPVSSLHPVPDSIDDDHAVFANLVSSALQGAQQLTIVNRPYITVLGDGPLGLITAQIMAKLNASVRLIGKHAQKMTHCEKLGIKHRPISEVGQHADQDVVVDCTGSAQGLAIAMKLVRPRGKIVLKSLAPQIGTDSAIDLTSLTLNEIELIGSHTGSIGEALSVIDRREVDVASLISRRMKLNDGPALLKAAENPDVLRVIVEP